MFEINLKTARITWNITARLSESLDTSYFGEKSLQRNNCTDTVVPTIKFRTVKRTYKEHKPKANWPWL